MKKIMAFVLLAFAIMVGIVLSIMYAVNPYKTKRLFGLASPRNVYMDRLRDRPYTKGGYDGIDVSKHNGIIKWGEVAKNKKVKFVYIKATEGKGYIDRLYQRNLRQARKAGLKVGSYHFFTSQSSVSEQFLHFSKLVKRNEQDLIPVLDIEESGVNGAWKGKQLQDSVWRFAELVKKHYGKYPIVYSNESYYNNELGYAFDRLILFIANYQNRPRMKGHGKCNIWQYSEKGHLKGIGEFVDLNRLQNGTTVKDLML